MNRCRMASVKPVLKGGCCSGRRRTFAHDGPCGLWCRFAEMLKAIDSKKTELGVTGYGLSVTTMEEVFLRISEGSSSPASSIPVVRCCACQGRLSRHPCGRPTRYFGGLASNICVRSLCNASTVLMGARKATGFA